MLNALVTNLAAEGEAVNNPLIPAWYDIIWSGVCFIVILLVFWKVVLPRMQELLDRRSAQERALADARHELDQVTQQLRHAEEGRMQAERGYGAVDRDGWQASIEYLDDLGLVPNPITIEDVLRDDLLPPGD